MRKKEDQTKEKERAKRDDVKKIVKKGGAHVQLIGIKNAIRRWLNIQNILKILPKKTKARTCN